jgi:hypothetical protein
MLTIKHLSASKELDRAALGAAAGGEGAPSFELFDYSNDLFDILGAAYQSDATTLANVGNRGSLVFSYVDNDKDINV